MRWGIVLVASLLAGAAFAEEAAEKNPSRREIYEMILGQTRTLCEERNPNPADQIRFCSAQFLHTETRELTDWSFAKYPPAMPPVEALDLEPIFVECWEKAMDGKLVYAPFANLCIRARVEDAAVDRRRQERLRIERDRDE